MPDTPSDNSDFETDADAPNDLRLIDDDPRFMPDEMVRCAACSRSNPPDRKTCLYCGEPVDLVSIRADRPKISYQRPEVWEDGFTLVYAGKVKPSDETTRVSAELLEVDVELLIRAIDVGFPVPLIYLRSLPDAEILASRLSEKGFYCAVVGDDLLQAKVPPSRVRSVRFENSAIVLEDFNTGRSNEIKVDEKILFVAGSLLRSSTETSGKVSKKAIRNIEETHGFSDESVIDIYPPADVYGFRIRAAGFDFSCLGDRMQPLAGKNMKLLIGELGARCASSIVINSFKAAQSIIATVWPMDEVGQTSNVSRGALGGVYKQSLKVLDNNVQFTKFSRLQRHFV